MLLLLLLLAGSCEWTAANSASGGVACVFFNEDYMTCDWGSKGKPAANYSLYYWFSGQSSPPAECKHYLQSEDGINTGCWFNASEILMCCDFSVYVNASRAKDIRGEFGLVQHLVKPGQPINVTVRNVSGNELLLTWETPFHASDCLEHTVKYQTNKDSGWTEQKVQQMEFNIPSVDPDKFYTFYVRSKIGQACGTTELWSEATGPIFWGKNATGSSGGSASGGTWFWVQNVLLPAGSFLLLLMFLVLLVRMERVWLVLMPRIPNPSKKFEELFTSYQGNFSEWAGVSKDVVESFKPSYRESICRVSELLPGGGYLPLSSDAVGKTGRAPGGDTDHLPKASPE